MNKVNNNFKEKFNAFGKKKDDYEDYINKSFIRIFRKKRKILQGEDENYFNDYKNLSLIFIYTLLNKTNTTFITSDFDVFYNIITWTESICNHLTIKHLLLSRLKQEGMHRVMKGEKITYHIKYKKFENFYNELFDDFRNRDWKKDSFSIKIKFWDTTKQKYNNGICYNFNEQSRELLLHLHGQFICPFSPNHTDGNYMRYRYYWPPKSIKNIDEIKVEVIRKNFVHGRPPIVSREVHRDKCQYYQIEMNNNLLDVVRSFNVII